ncbi:phosphomannomutase [Vibrio cyclitrophicus]|uniref:phosphomannomutase n=1 Tax=Vibrio cyclitrophicus TaxID=47951 RepID=UPI000316605A|nr:phosphomannomutase [Vibrio cyclitrophicus]OEF27582.1 phosphomannomutase [Vibrio cyclitrophicus 1F97]OEF43696.1 phosphomannomutase [Vibrio cyclitrophicus 1F273]OEF75398.1 phosphomannomutase [Vibrio cyclitrophicus 1F111]
MAKKLISSKVLSASGVQFGTSGARGLVTQFTSDVCAAFTHAFVVSMRRNFTFTQMAVAIDNRPSSPIMAQAVIQALTDAGVDAVYYGVVPTPALAFTAMQDNMPCIMVTGSHIPFERNGIKFYRPDGEITKADEQMILTENAEFSSIEALPDLVIDSKASELYKKRYTSLFDSDLLTGKRIGIYEHSSAGRDIYQNLFEALGAEVVALERSDEFVPIDTEAVSESDKEKARIWSREYKLDFIFSTDGDGDRPLVADEDGEWLRGDILGLLCSKALQVDALAVPVSCNTIIADSKEFKAVSKTCIGSPYVIAEFSELKKQYRRVAGFEANGGYLLGSDIDVNGKVIKALPTRDAVLPALMLLSIAKKTMIRDLVADLPQRFTYSDRLQGFATDKSLELLKCGYQNPADLLDKIGLGNLEVISTDSTDGLRLKLSDDTYVHLRPSGNAPELRCYTEATNVQTAMTLVDQVLCSIRAM